MKSILGGAVAAAVLAAGVAHAKTYDLRIGMATINDPQHTFTKKYGEELEKRSGGQIKVTVFPAGQLGKIPRQIENLKLGAQGGFISPPGFFSGINRAFQAPDAPGLYKGYWHAQNAFTTPEFRNKFLKLAEKQGVIGVALFNYGSTSIASLNPIRTLDDMKGLKIRVLATKMESKLAATLGMTGVPMPFTEVLPALQRKTIDGCRSSMVVMGALKFYTTTKYITVIESGMIPSAMWISTRWLKKLPKNLQQMVKDTGRDLEVWAGRNAYAFGQRAEKVWRDNGAEIIHLSPKDQATLTAKLAPLGDEFLGKDPVTGPMYRLLKKVLATASTEPK